MTEATYTMERLLEEHQRNEQIINRIKQEVGQDWGDNLTNPVSFSSQLAPAGRAS